MYAGLDIFVLLACPLFILAADIMNESGITARLIAFANLIVGRFRGGLGHTNVLASMLFAGISGAALADASGLGSIEIPMMEKAGYDKDFSAAVTAASAIIGPIIPPSIIMVIYAVVAANVSIIGLFMAGIVPGLFLGGILMILIFIISRNRNYPTRSYKIKLLEILKITKDAVIALMMPVIILGGILLGIFTPTEAAAVAVLYAFIVGIFVTRELKLSILPKILLRSFTVTSVIFLIISCANICAYFLAISQVPDKIANAIMSVTKNPYLFLLLVNLFFLILGCIMEPGAGIIISVPVFAPLAEQFGIHPLHFGIIVTVNLSIGCITPPIGTSLYAVATVAKIPVEKLIRSIYPLIAGEIVILLVITYFPVVSLALPKFFGLIK
jgi:C4-dicarboxylate transporter DctM subunit